MNKTLNRKLIQAAASVCIAIPLAAQTPAVGQRESVLMASVFVPSRTSETAAKPIADRPLKAETLKPEPQQVPLPKLSFPKAASATSVPAGAASLNSHPVIAFVPASEAPTARQFGLVKVEPGAISYQTAMGTNIDAQQRFGAVPGVTRFTFGRQ